MAARPLAAGGSRRCLLRADGSARRIGPYHGRVRQSGLLRRLHRCHGSARDRDGVGCVVQARPGLARALTALLVVVLLFTQSRGGMVTFLVGFTRSHSYMAGGRASITAAAVGLGLCWHTHSSRPGGSMSNPGQAANLMTAAGRPTHGHLRARVVPLVAHLRHRTRPVRGCVWRHRSHNWYVQVLAELGLVGIAIWGLFYPCRRDRPQKPTALGTDSRVFHCGCPGRGEHEHVATDEFQAGWSILIALAAAVVARWQPRSGREGTIGDLQGHRSLSATVPAVGPVAPHIDEDLPDVSAGIPG